MYITRSTRYRGSANCSVPYGAASSLCCMLVTVAVVRASCSQHNVTLVLAARVLLAVGKGQFQPESSNFVPWRRRLIAGLSSRGLGFDLKSVCVIFVVDRVELGEVFLRVLRFSPFSIMP